MASTPTPPAAPPLRETPLHARHLAAGATMVPFAGWSMPVKYTSDVAEHTAVRNAVGLFDISHMAQIAVVGPDAAAFLDHALAGRFATLAPLQSRYTMMLTPAGGIVDDLIVTNAHLPEPPHGGAANGGAARDHAAAPGGESAPPTRFLVVANAANRDTVLAALAERTRRPGAPSADADAAVAADARGLSDADGRRDFDVTIADMDRALVALQGPRAEAVLADLVAAGELTLDPGAGVEIGTLRYYRTAPGTYRGVPVVLSRTGYTGEDGFEISIEKGAAGALWDALVAIGQDPERGHGLVLAGLAARDTLRLEAGMPLYGHELSLSTQPSQARLGRVVATTKPEFVGREAVLAGPAADAPVLVGLALPGRRAGRAGYPVLDASGARIGQVTSGVLSPTLGYPIAMAYVAPEHAALGTTLAVDVRGTAIPATVVDLPFYRRSKES